MVKKNEKQIISKNIKDTEKIAKDFLKKILMQKNKQATVVGLFGNLGAGKTAFTQAVGKILGIKRKLNSPTFVIMKKYPLRHSGTSPLPRGRKGGGYKLLYHLDAYRLKNEKELIHLGWKEIISNPEHLVFIEWPENVKKAMPKKHHQVHISHLPRRSGAKWGTKEEHRKFKIKHS